MEINTIDYFGASVNMVIIDNTLAIGRINSETYLVESVFSNECYLDIMSADQCEEVYGVNPNEISYFN